ncbi:MAG: Fic family protein [Rhizobiales bacterium]|nr:Fic family protein [Hyphomicrobiales bacterium]
MYEAGQDPYCYPGTTVLKNRLGLRTQAELQAFEAEITAQRAAEPLPAGRLSYAHYKAIHRHLFQDAYSWAGRIRTIRIAKGANAFCYPEHIEHAMCRLFTELAGQHHFHGMDANGFAQNAAHFLAELNAIHPFREGNGRTQLSFLTLLAERAGHPLRLERLTPQEILDAIIKSFGGNEKPLCKVLGRLVG